MTADKIEAAMLAALVARSAWPSETIRVCSEVAAAAVVEAVAAERARYAAVRKLLVDADSICYLVAYRGLDDHAKDELKRVSTAARAALAELERP